MHKLSQNGLNFIKDWEKFSPAVYKCQAGFDTIGFGHRKKAGEIFTIINIEKALQLLDADCDIAENCVNKAVFCPLNQNQFDALTSLVFNIGTNAFRTSTLLKYLNKEDYECAADEFNKWVFVKGEKSNGLINRRNKERELFLS